MNLLLSFLPIWAFMPPPMMRTLCLEMLQTRGLLVIEGIEVLFITSICSRWSLCWGSIIILSGVFLLLSRDFRVCGLRSITTPPMTALTEFLHENTETNVHLLSVLWYFISTLLWWYLCSCMHTMSMLCSTTDAVSSTSWPILFKVLMLNVAISNLLLHLSKFCLCLSLSSVADFSNTRARAPTSVECTSFFTCAKCDAVWTHGLSESHGNLLMAVFLPHQ